MIVLEAEYRSKAWWNFFSPSVFIDVKQDGDDQSSTWQVKVSYKSQYPELQFLPGPNHPDQQPLTWQVTMSRGSYFFRKLESQKAYGTGGELFSLDSQENGSGWKDLFLTLPNGEQFEFSEKKKSFLRKYIIVKKMGYLFFMEGVKGIGSIDDPAYLEHAICLTGYFWHEFYPGHD